MKNDSKTDLRSMAVDGTPNQATSDFVLTNPEPTPEAPESVGQLLRYAREQAGLSVSDVATRLRVGAKQIDALERADYANVPSGTFLRGFVRNYAKAVNVDQEEALRVLERTHAAASAVLATKEVAPIPAVAPVKVSPATLSVSGAESGKRSAIMALGVLVLLAAAVAYWWLEVRPHRADGGRPKVEAAAPIAVQQPAAVSVPADAASSPVTPITPNADTIAVAQPTVTPVSGTPTAPVDSAQAPTAPPVSASFQPSDAASTSSPVAPAISLAPVKPAPESATSRRPGEGTVGFTFTGDSWVQVVDATGRTILSKSFKAGDAEEVTGRGPLAVVVGNAKSTRMAFNGREFDLAPHTRVAVARVTLK
jgi:cytoskeleton protein RodZ